VKDLHRKEPDRGIPRPRKAGKGLVPGYVNLPSIAAGSW